MAASPAQTEGLRQISEWCKWLVTVESVTVGLIATLVVKDPHSSLLSQGFTKWSLFIALGSFVCSIFTAGTIVSAIPTAITDMGKDENGNDAKVMDRHIYLFGSSFGPFWAYTNVLFISFL